MAIFSLHTSSIFNIDFGAIPYIEKYYEEVILRIFLNTTVKVASNKLHRKYESRLAIPTLNWEMDKNNDWRLVHIPIEEFKEDVNKNLKILKNSYLKLAPNYKFQIIEDYFSELEIILEKKSDKFSLYEDIIQNSIRAISDNIIVHIDNLNNAYDLSNDESRMLIIYCLSNIFKSIQQNRIVRFTNGGSIELEGNFNLKFSKVLKKGNTINLFDDFDNAHSFEFKELIDSIRNKETKVRFFGMLELFFMNHFGNLFHLPSYCGISKLPNSAPFKVYEFISPMSNKDLNRTSSSLTPIRLKPLGYSLLDIDSQMFLDMLKQLIGETDIKIDSLTDWYNIYLNYPKSSEKVAADQNPVSKYFDENHQKIKKEIRSANFSRISLSNSLASISFPQSGEYFIQFYSFLRFLIASIHHKDSQILFEKFKSKRELKPLLELCDTARAICENIFRKLIKLGINENEKNSIEKLLKKWDKQLKLHQNKLIDYEERHLFECFIASALRPIRTIAIHYYKFVVFLISTIFKSNLFLISVMFEKSEFQSKLENMISSRDIKHLEQLPNYFEET